MKKSILLISVLGICLLILAEFNPALAVVSISSEFGRDTILSSLGGSIGHFTSITQLFNPFLATAYILAGIVVFFVLLAGGFLVIMGAGQSDSKKLDQGKQAITWGLLGLMVVVVSYWIMLIVQTITGIDIMGGEGL